MNFRFLTLACVLLLMGCSIRYGLHGDVFYSRGLSYYAKAPSDSFRPVHIRDADLAYYSASDGATVLFNSACKGDETPLKALAGHLLMGMTEQQILGERLFLLSGREALDQHVRAKLDGVSRDFRVIVLKKDGCVFDIVLSSPKVNFETHSEALDGLLADYFAEVKAP